jgi:hypothetical protein
MKSMKNVDQHLVNEACRAVLHDRRWLRQEGHVELRRMRAAGGNGRPEKQEGEQGYEARNGHRNLLGLSWGEFNTWPYITAEFAR